MAILALILAVLLAYLGLRRGDLTTSRLLLALGAASALLALYLALFEPRLAWDLAWVGRLMTRLAGHAMRDALR
jgi:hypothetical protein